MDIWLRTRVGLLALGTGLTLVVTGCGGADEDPDPVPTPGDGSGSSTSSAADPSSSDDPSAPSSDASGTDPAAEDTYADVEPATGEQLAVDGVTLNVPDDYTVKTQGGGNGAAYWDKYSSDNIGVVAVASNGKAESLEKARRGFNEDAGLSRYDFEASDPVVVDGVDFFHQEGQIPDSSVVVEAFGAWTEDVYVTIEFDFDSLTKPARRERVVESVMATVDLAS